MSKETVDLTFGDLLNDRTVGGMKVHSDIMTDTRIGVQFKLPTLQRHAISVSDLALNRPSVDGLRWISDAPLLRLIRTIPVTSKTGTLPVGSALPSATMTGERGAGAGWHTDPGLKDFDFSLDSVVEVRTQHSTISTIQSDFESLDDAIEEAHRAAQGERLEQQILHGTGSGNQLEGLTRATGVQSATYASAARGNGAAFDEAEQAIEDRGGRLESMAWFLGSTLDASSRETLLEPGSDRRTIEGGRMTLSGTRAHRSRDLPGTTAICADLRNSVTLLVQEQIIFVTDRITEPGSIRLTSRLPVALVLSRPELVYVLTEA